VLAVGVSDDGLGAPIAGAEDEARAVGDEVLVGDAATEGALRGRLARPERWRAVHLACHGLVDPGRPLRSALSLRPSEGRDGLWTVAEILGTRVAADVVVLSACSTARGEALGPDGVLGFVHAFFVAGARRVLASLWDVDDRATRELMRRFHESWRSGRDPAAALRAAQSALRADPRFAHPAHWAGWQLWG
jgi:CHAT domain-containing protein